MISKDKKSLCHIVIILIYFSCFQLIKCELKFVVEMVIISKILKKISFK